MSLSMSMFIYISLTDSFIWCTRGLILAERGGEEWSDLAGGGDGGGGDELTRQDHEERD